MICLGVAAAAFGLGSCERHEWEDTKQLYEAHGEGEHAAGEEKDH